MFGNPSQIDVPSRFERIPDHDYFLFTNIDSEHLNTSWDVINIEGNKAVHDLDCKIRKSRYPKWMGRELLHQEYDAIFYCDAFYSPKSNVDWAAYAKQIKNKEFGFMQALHGHRFGVGDELDYIAHKNKDTKANTEKTKKFFKKYDASVNLHENIYYVNTAFGYDPNNELVKTILSEFWNIYSNEDITFRDQPLWNFLLLKFNRKPIISKDFDVKHSGSAFKKSGREVGHTLKQYLSQ